MWSRGIILDLRSEADSGGRLSRRWYNHEFMWPSLVSQRASWVQTLIAIWALALFVPARATGQTSNSTVPLQLNEALEAAKQLPRLHSLLVSWRGELVLEQYYNGTRPARPANVKSASKSVISALVGIAIDRGLIKSVQQPIASFFPELLKADGDPRKRSITIENLLSMQAGLDTTSNRNYGAWVRSPNWVRHILTRELVSEPGTSMEYSTGNTHLLSAILTKVTSTSTWRFAQDALAKPLGFSLTEWPRDPQGIYFGGNDMLLTPRQMVAFGLLYLNRGRANNQQIVPSAWVESSIVPRTVSRWSERFYGYGWWIRELAGRQAFYAWGFGGQYIFVVPTLDLVVVSTSSVNSGDERRNHRQTVDALIESLVIEPISTFAETSSKGEE